MNSLLDRITVDPAKCGGKPCIRGHRLRVRDVIELLAHGDSWPEIIKSHPFLEPDDIRACIAFTAQQLERAPDSPAMLAALDLGIQSLRDEPPLIYTRAQLREKVRRWAHT